MEQPSHLAKRFREVLLNGKWIANTNYHEKLADVTWQQANTRIGSLNSIAQLTFHINYFIAGVLDVFEGGDLEIRDKYSFDMPPIASQVDWERLRSELKQNSERFAIHLDRMPQEQLDTDFVDPKYGSYRRNIEGMIEHAYYHLGQISLIKTMVAKS